MNERMNESFTQRGGQPGRLGGMIHQPVTHARLGQ